MKTRKTLFGIAAIASIVVGIVACATGSDKTNNRNDTHPDAGKGIVGRGVTEAHAAAGSQDSQAEPIVFTDRNIEWFNSVTREIRFREIEPAKDLKPYKQIDFELNGEMLFSAATAITPLSSRIVNDLVLYIERENDYRYYLHDGYPVWAGESDQAKANAAARAFGWDKFLAHLRNEGKLREYNDNTPDIPGGDNVKDPHDPITPNIDTGGIELTELPCLAPDDVKNLSFNTLYILRSEEQMRQVLGDKSYPGIDFAKNTLLLVRMTAANGIVCLGYGLTGDANGYTYSVTAFTNDTEMIGDKTAAVLAPAFAAVTEVAFTWRVAEYTAE